MRYLILALIFILSKPVFGEDNISEKGTSANWNYTISTDSLTGLSSLVMTNYDEKNESEYLSIVCIYLSKYVGSIKLNTKNYFPHDLKNIFAKFDEQNLETIPAKREADLKTIGILDSKYYYLEKLSENKKLMLAASNYKDIPIYYEFNLEGLKEILEKHKDYCYW